MTNNVVFIQARTGSTRLPAKVLKKVLGVELLIHAYNRVKLSKKADNVVVITSINKNDNKIEELCLKNNIPCFRGSENDLLDRHYQAALEYNADYIFKIPSDSPLTDYRIIDEVINISNYYNDKFDFYTNLHPCTFPDGLDIEGCSMKILKNIWTNASKTHQREHTFPYIWENSDKFKIYNVQNNNMINNNMYMTHRWTLDYEEDYQFIKRVFEEFNTDLVQVDKSNNDNDNNYKYVFSTNDILDLLESKPEIAEINSKYAGVNWYRNVDNINIPRYMYKTTEPLKLDNSLAHLQKTKELIPAATHTLSKGYTQWSVGACPLFAKSAKGCEITDIDGNIFIDYGMALGPFILGYSNEKINNAVKEQLDLGTMFTLPSQLEFEAAEAVKSCVPCAEMVKFGKNGSDATSCAVKLARAFTKRDKIIVCGYHGWHDWYIITTERNEGIPSSYKDYTISLKYNDLDALRQIIADNPDEIAGIIMEPVCATPPENNFLEAVRNITKQHNIILIFDELFTGFRCALGGAQEYFNVIPDLACFGKAIANGFPISCICGRKDIMQLLDEKVFYSFTYGGETLSLCAVKETIKQLKSLSCLSDLSNEETSKYKVYNHIKYLGQFLIDGFNNLIKENEMENYISIIGYPFKSVVNFKINELYTPLMMKTYMQQECAKRGVLFIGYHLISYSHNQHYIDFTLNVYNDIMKEMKILISNNELESKIEGALVTQIFNNVGDRSSN
jgi:glutamate-1-semialdehyde aminotransferase/spore coat polysaccharide biosynthesis protein SpsF (cytidylyltransferase family)